MAYTIVTDSNESNPVEKRFSATALEVGLTVFASNKEEALTLLNETLESMAFKPYSCVNDDDEDDEDEWNLGICWR